MTNSKRYVVSDVKKIKTDAELHKLLQHVLRETTSLKNVDYSRTWKNSVLLGSTTSEQVRIDMACKVAGCSKRKNGVKALAFLLSHSHEVETKINLRRTEWEAENVRWLEERYGKENVLLAVTNKDEKTTHIHALVLPVLKKKKGDQIVEKLDARTVLGDRTKMREMHDSYANAMSMFGLERGENYSLKRKLTMAEIYCDKKEERDHQERRALSDEKNRLLRKLIAYEKENKVALMIKKIKLLEKELEAEKNKNKQGPK